MNEKIVTLLTALVVGAGAFAGGMAIGTQFKDEPAPTPVVRPVRLSACDQLFQQLTDAGTDIAAGRINRELRAQGC